ncbi:helix-turn-helix transcriptional regulator [Vibrio breoganii]
MVSNKFKLGKNSTELFISQDNAPLFSSQQIRMAGVTHVADEYLCSRKNPDHHTLLFTLSGNATVESKGQTIALTASSMVLLKHDVDFVYYKTDNHWDFVWFILEPTSNWAGMNSLPLSLGKGHYNDNLMHMLHLLTLDVPFETRKILNQDIHLYIQKSIIQFGAPDIEGQLERLFLEVDQQLHFPWTTQVMAKKLHVSEPTLHRLCKSIYQQSPKQKVIELRIKRAQFLLLNTHWPLAVIAEQVGYKDGFGLSKMCKKVLGVSPESLRNRADG